jgi:hypothetical protein
MSIYWRFELALAAVMVAHEIATGTLRGTRKTPVGQLHKTKEMRRHPRIGKWLLFLALIVQLVELIVWLRS